MVEPNPQQRLLTDLPVGNILAVAPAGCGKTEALAARVAAVIQRGEVVLPRRVLALTFSNKARDNLATRLGPAVGPGWRRRVGVANFHGLAARVVKAHGTTLGIPKDVVLPDETWRKRQARSLGIDYRTSDGFEGALRTAKAGRFDDDEVMERLEASGHAEAVEFERRRRAESRLDYDDLIRHGSRLLEIDEIAALYQAHFGMVVVDEVQDLTVLQYDMARAVGADRVTYAGDPAQGIYAFAGADPAGVFARISDLGPEVVEFNLSYRSSPAVLRAVNALTAEMGGTQLECADPGRWPDDGHVVSLERHDTDAEAAAVIGMIAKILEEPEATIGVVARRGSRSAAIRSAAEQAGLDFEDWSTPTHVPHIVELLSKTFRRAKKADGADTAVIDVLEEMCVDLIDPADAHTRDEIVSACDDLREMVAAGMSAADAMAGCRASTAPDKPVGPGLHLLTGHKGKGQEFDWVFVLGLEDGHIPDFRNTDGDQREEELRVLHVMVSRARYGVVLTYSKHTPSRAGWWATVPSPWLDTLRGTATATDHS